MALYDVCAFTLAFLDEGWTQTGFTFNPKGRDELYAALKVPMERRDGDPLAPSPENAEADLAEFRQSIKAKADTE